MELICYLRSLYLFQREHGKYRNRRVENAPYCVAGRLGTTTLGLSIALFILIFNQVNLFLMNCFYYVYNQMQ